VTPGSPSHDRTVVTIDNTLPRRDQHGNILNAHDGHVFQVPGHAHAHPDGTFFLVGTSYTNCHMTMSDSCAGGNDKLYPQDSTHILNHPACG
jgi:hypothetical protein